MSPTTRRPAWWSVAAAALLAAALLTPALLPLTTSQAADAASGWDDTNTLLQTNPRGIVLDHGRPRIIYDDNTHETLFFGWCNSRCGESASWRSVELADGLDLDGSELAIDRSGRLHVAYIDLAADGVFYATCATTCGDAGSWSHVKVDTTTDQDGLTLAVDPWGRPRLSYIRSRPDVETSPKTVFAACDTDCTTLGAWETVVLPWAGGKPSLAFDGAHPHLVYSSARSGPGSDLRYMTCRADCFNKRAWKTTVVTWFDSIGEPSVVVDGSRVHIAFNPAGAAATTLAYTRCDDGCTDADNWDDSAFITPGDRAVVPQLEVTNGKPRITYVHCVNRPGFVGGSGYWIPTPRGSVCWAA